MDRSRFLYAPSLRYFALAAEEGSIRAAARKLNVASSAVNRQILTLEAQLDLQLFDRVGRRIRLSPAGEILLAHIKRTLSDFSGTIDELDALKGVRRGHVSIAAVESVSEALLPQIIQSFQRQYAGIHIRVQVAGSAQVLQAVEQAEVDVGFTFNAASSTSLNIAFRRELQIGAIMHPEHPLANEPEITVARCMSYPIALPSEDLSLRTQLNAVLDPADVRANMCLEANSLRFMKKMIADKLSIAFQTQIGTEREQEEGELIFRPLMDSGLRPDQFTIVTSAMRSLALAPAIFFDHSIATMKDLLPHGDAVLAS
ncbi:LysR family transcriptional regulator [Rhodobacteraceae bacterium RKSG542]|uniref:LysR family transcriptional regulator n=1 Tax=Pseudovibrio flavus TaxID=2529854 RepID=UPI0012BD0D40|nr:LysR family transcriptional regulator [Pseudovibrio flavus]MTI17543.1 LysR family transcriptional regulator [Pseudovibrio flavus]